MLKKIQNKNELDILDDEDFDITQEKEITLDFKEGGKISEDKIQKQTKNMLDLDGLKFESGGHFMSNSR